MFKKLFVFYFIFLSSSLEGFSISLSPDSIPSGKKKYSFSITGHVLYLGDNYFEDNFWGSFYRRESLNYYLGGSVKYKFSNKLSVISELGLLRSHKYYEVQSNIIKGDLLYKTLYLNMFPVHLEYSFLENVSKKSGYFIRIGARRDVKIVFNRSTYLFLYPIQTLFSFSEPNSNYYGVLQTGYSKNRWSGSIYFMRGPTFGFNFNSNQADNFLGLNLEYKL
jgi:hypothetical protein